ncbi:MAG: PRC-barrel domain containing protein [Desulfobacteraceae bacterium]|nr:MAG: PRC-barrel domain containing protein [Desulfobacteraceae bacterium]
MLRSTNEILGYRLNTIDQDVGSCKDLLFDDQWWTIRHLLANTGVWMIGKKVLISPAMINKPDWKTRNIFLNVSKDEIEKCPAPIEDEPVSREYERKMSRHYGIPYYWGDAGLWGPAAYPYAVEPVLTESMNESEEDVPEQETENHLRSIKEVTGYDIKASDGNIGHVEDFIMDDDTWALRYVIVDTRNWLPGGKKVLLPLTWAESVSWTRAEFEVNLSKSEIENCPEFDPEKPINVEYEARVYDYYGRPLDTKIDRAAQQHIANPFV